MPGSVLWSLRWFWCKGLGNDIEYFLGSALLRGQMLDGLWVRRLGVVQVVRSGASLERGRGVLHVVLRCWEHLLRWSGWWEVGLGVGGCLQVWVMLWRGVLGLLCVECLVYWGVLMLVREGVGLGVEVVCWEGVVMALGMGLRDVWRGVGVCGGGGLGSWMLLTGCVLGHGDVGPGLICC